MVLLLIFLLLIRDFVKDVVSLFFVGLSVSKVVKYLLLVGLNGCGNVWLNLGKLVF